MSDIIIPPAALEAGARAITMALILAVEDDCRALALTDDERMELSRAAFLAMIEAWPGMTLHQQDINTQYSYFVLPLPQQENSDAKR